MPRKAKTLDTTSKHLTKSEIAARTDAEYEVIPDRETVSLEMPSYLRHDAAGKAYWKSILKRMEGFAILDDLDAEVLGVYCSMLSRRDAAEKLLTPLTKASENGDMAVADLLKLTAQIEALMGKLQGQERIILTYADKLGLTPTGRVSLARKRAAKANEPDNEENDLFGD